MNGQQLMNLLKFEESDLRLNRSGRISEKQSAQLNEMESTAKRQSLLGSVGNFFMALVGLGGAALMLRTNINGINFGAIIFSVIFGILWPLMWGTAGFSGLRRSFAKVDATLKKAEGPIVIEKTVRSSYDSDSRVTTHQNVYILRVGGQTFTVNPALQNYMKRDEVYSVYYADFNHKERSKEILSLELLKNSGGDSAKEIVPTIDVEIVECVKKGDLMEAIRLYRSIHGSGFEEASSIVQGVKAQLGI